MCPNKKSKAALRGTPRLTAECLAEREKERAADRFQQGRLERRHLLDRNPV
jgi:hypothetical protein